jgi:hypothetical protein
MQYLAFSVWLISLDRIFLEFICIVQSVSYCRYTVKNKCGRRKIKS